MNDTDGWPDKAKMTRDAEWYNKGWNEGRKTIEMQLSECQMKNRHLESLLQAYEEAVGDINTAHDLKEKRENAIKHGYIWKGN